jgi:hypothetical protein
MISMLGKPSRTIVTLAMSGLAIAGASYAYWALHNYGRPMNPLDFALTTILMILCPPQLLFVMCIDCEVVGWGGFIMYSIIGILNAGLYAGIGAVIVSLRKARPA